MTKEEIKATIVRLLGRIAPEVDFNDIDSSVPLRDQLDIDSMDFLNFVVALNKELGVDIPEKDYNRFATLDDAVDYLQTKLATRIK